MQQTNTANPSLSEVFANRRNLLSIYFTAGYPQLDDTAQVIKALDSAGVDMIEVGFPFSDPLADGPVIQESSKVALSNGINTQLIFDQLKSIKGSVQAPLIAMGYLNPVLQFGMERYLQCCVESGIQAVILPDMPVEVYREEYADLFEKYEIPMVFLITPSTSDERIRLIDSISKSFIYMVSTSATTGARTGFSETNLAYFERVKALQLRSPLIIGFGISNSDTFNQACQFANGAIIGSAYIKAIAEGDLAINTEHFIRSIKA